MRWNIPVWILILCHFRQFIQGHDKNTVTNHQKIKVVSDKSTTSISEERIVTIRTPTEASVTSSDIIRARDVISDTSTVSSVTADEFKKPEKLSEIPRVSLNTTTPRHRLGATRNPEKETSEHQTLVRKNEDGKDKDERPASLPGTRTSSTGPGNFKKILVAAGETRETTTVQTTPVTPVVLHEIRKGAQEHVTLRGPEQGLVSRITSTVLRARKRKLLPPQVSTSRTVIPQNSTVMLENHIVPITSHAVISQGEVRTGSPKSSSPRALSTVQTTTPCSASSRSFTERQRVTPCFDQTNYSQSGRSVASKSNSIILRVRGHHCHRLEGRNFSIGVCAPANCTEIGWKDHWKHICNPRILGWNRGCPYITCVNDCNVTSGETVQCIINYWSVPEQIYCCDSSCWKKEIYCCTKTRRQCSDTLASLIQESVAPKVIGRSKTKESETAILRNPPRETMEKFVPLERLSSVASSTQGAPNVTKKYVNSKPSSMIMVIITGLFFMLGCIGFFFNSICPNCCEIRTDGDGIATRFLEFQSEHSHPPSECNDICQELGKRLAAQASDSSGTLSSEKSKKKGDKTVSFASKDKKAASITGSNMKSSSAISKKKKGGKGIPGSEVQLVTRGIQTAETAKPSLQVGTQTSWINAIGTPERRSGGVQVKGFALSSSAAEIVSKQCYRLMRRCITTPTFHRAEGHTAASRLDSINKSNQMAMKSFAPTTDEPSPLDFFHSALHNHDEFPLRPTSRAAHSPSTSGAAQRRTFLSTSVFSRRHSRISDFPESPTVFAMTSGEDSSDLLTRKNCSCSLTTRQLESPSTGSLTTNDEISTTFSPRVLSMASQSLPTSVSVGTSMGSVLSVLETNERTRGLKPSPRKRSTFKSALVLHPRKHHGDAGLRNET